MPDKPKVIITVGCRNLPHQPNKGYKVIMDVGFEGFSHHKDTLKTETLTDCSPDFKSDLLIDYVFEEKQVLIATIYSSDQFNQERIIGSCCASIGRVVHCGGSLEIPIDIVDPKDIQTKEKPTFIVSLREHNQKRNSFLLKMTGIELDKKDLFGKSDPYLVLFKKSDKGKWTRTYRTEIIKSNLNPDWKPLPICLNKLCDEDMDKSVLIQCFDWDGADGDPEDMDSEFDEIIGECSFTCQKLLDAFNNTLTLELINYKKQKKKRAYINSGKIKLSADLSLQSFSFLDFMFSGIDLNFIVAVDLSHPKLNVEDQIESIRLYNVTRQSNEYEVAIKAVLEILQEYDSDKQFPAFGFGALVPPDFKECHEYPLNGDFQNPFCTGVDGVLRAYQNTLRSIRPMEKAQFAPVIRQVNSLAKNHVDGRHYFILLVLTNGTAEDWVDTKKAVIEASYLPVSIIVVGIGSGAFTDMKTLDQDFDLLKVGNNKALRDNVQFVPMRKFLRMAADGSRSIKWNKVALAKEVLAELPEQLEAFMHQNNIQPQSRSQSLTQQQQTIEKSIKEHQKLRRCVTAHVNIRPSSSSERDGKRSGESPAHANFFSNRSLRKTSIDTSSKDDDDRKGLTRRK